jgi:hypothetical protein
MEQDPVFFKPSIGPDYLTSPLSGARVLIVGESHYVKEEEKYPEFAIDCVREQAEGQWTKAFWTNIAVAFLGRLPATDEELGFWHSVAFYNFVQQLIGAKAWVRPKREMWQSSHDAFAQVLDELEPEFALVLGYALWDSLPGLDGHEGPEIIGAVSLRKPFLRPSPG